MGEITALVLFGFIASAAFTAFLLALMGDSPLERITKHGRE